MNKVVILCYVHFTTIKKKIEDRKPQLMKVIWLRIGTYVFSLFKKKSLIENLKDSDIPS